jgi:hypothetical protein
MVLALVGTCHQVAFTNPTHQTAGRLSQELLKSAPQ